MKKLIIILVLSGLASYACGQYYSGIRGLRNGIYGEAYLTPKEFSSGVFSMNYEHFFGRKYSHSIRVGVLPDFKSALSFPITWTYITRPYARHHLEVGLGLVAHIDFFDGGIYHDVASAMMPVMYRYTGNGRFYFRAGLNIFYNWPVLPTPSLSLGYRF